MPGAVSLDDRPLAFGRQFVKAAAANPGLAFATLRFAERGLMRSVLSLTLKDQEVRRLRQSPGRWVVDEGPVHCLLWTLAFSKGGGDPALYAKHLSLPDAIVMLWTDPDTVMARTRSREESNIMSRVDESEARAAVKRYELYAVRLCMSAGIEVLGDLRG